MDVTARTATGCPIRVRQAHRSHAAPLARFAALRALRRHLAPRHPPCTRLRLAILSSRSRTLLAPRTSRYHPASTFVILACDPLARFGKIEVISQYAIVQVHVLASC